MPKKIIVIVLVALLIAAVVGDVFFTTRWQPKSQLISTTPVVAHHALAVHTQKRIIQINYDDYGFSPNIVTVPVGTQVVVANLATDGPMIFTEVPNQPSSNPALELGTINMGQQRSFVLTEKGTWQFQNGNESADRGVITAQ